MAIDRDAANQRFTTRVTQDMLDQLNDLADNAGVSRSAYARDLLADALEERLGLKSDPLDAMLAGVLSAYTRSLEAETQIKQAEAELKVAEAERIRAQARQEHAQADRMEYTNKLERIEQHKQLQIETYSRPKFLTEGRRAEIIEAFAQKPVEFSETINNNAEEETSAKFVEMSDISEKPQVEDESNVGQTTSEDDASEQTDNNPPDDTTDTEIEYDNDSTWDGNDNLEDEPPADEEESEIFDEYEKELIETIENKINNSDENSPNNEYSEEHPLSDKMSDTDSPATTSENTDYETGSVEDCLTNESPEPDHEKVSNETTKGFQNDQDETNDGSQKDPNMVSPETQNEPDANVGQNVGQTAQTVPGFDETAAYGKGGMSTTVEQSPLFEELPDTAEVVDDESPEDITDNMSPEESKTALASMHVTTGLNG